MKRALVLLATLGVAACTTVGPDYKRPDIALPANFQGEGASSQPQIPARWWTLYSDPQLAHRHYWWPLPHAALGTMHYEAGGFTLSRTPAEPGLPSPLLGEHNHHVFCELLGLPEAEYQDLLERKVIY